MFIDDVLREKSYAVFYRECRHLWASDRTCSNRANKQSNERKMAAPEASDITGEISQEGPSPKARQLGAAGRNYSRVSLGLWAKSSLSNDMMIDDALKQIHQ